MNFSEKNVSLEDFRSLNINSFFEPSKVYNSNELEKLFMSKRDTDAAIALFCICNMLLDPTDTNQPYKARFIIDDRRGVIPSDFSDPTLSSLKEFCGEIENSLLKAKVSDLLWITKKGKIEFAIVALENLKDIAEKLIQTGENTNINEGINLFERALRLSASLRRHPQANQIFLDIVDLIQEKLLLTDDLNFQKLKLIELLIEIASNDINHDFLISLLQDIARENKTEKNYLLTERAYQCLLQFAYLNKDKNFEHKINKKIAKCFLKQAKERDHGFVSASFIKSAIEYLSRVPDTRRKRVKLYELMRDYQREGMTHLHFFTTESTDITEIKERAIQNVQGKDLFDMLMRFSLYINLPEDLKKLKETSKIEIGVESGLSNIFTSSHIDHEALPVAEVRPNDTDNDEKIWEKTVQKLKINHQLSVAGKIYPVLEDIVKRYHLNEGYFYDLFRNNPFIPDGHLGYFAKGIFSGFTGDFLTATHLLVPQIENSLRFILSCSGEEPTKLHSDGTQERENLKNLLDNKLIQKILTKNISENLQVLLLDKIYGDHRNQISHGYMPTSYFNDVSSIYIWWFVFHILMIPNYQSWKKEYNPKIYKK